MPRSRITFRQLETFSAVARLRSFSKAAEALHLTQPAVSIQIRHIAEAIGLPVFVQSGRDIALTHAGEELLTTVRSLDDVWARFETAIDDLKGLKRGKLRVALVTTAKYFLPRMLGRFYQHYPDIEIELEIANRRKIIERLRANEDDLYVMSYPPEDLDITTHPFLDNEFVVLAPISHWAIGRKLKLQELAAEPFILRELGSGSRHAVDAHLQGIGLKLDVRLSLASNEAIRALVASGMGLTVLSRHALGGLYGEMRDEMRGEGKVDVQGSALAAQGLAELDVKGFPLKQPWNVVYLANKTLSLPAQRFLDELLESAANG